MREDLIELLDDIQRNGNDFKDVEIYGVRYPDTICNDDVADYLIANGVTIQRWIPVTERLPENDSDKPFAERTVYNVIINGFVHAARYGSKHGNIKYDWWVDPRGYVIGDKFFREVTHWQPAPIPPKEDLK